MLTDDIAANVQALAKLTPQARALGIVITKVAPNRAWGYVPYRADLVGDPDTGVLAGGVVTTFLDHLCGSAVAASLTRLHTLATIDLRIDYLRGSTPTLDLRAEAHCYKVTRHVAFARALAYDSDPDDPVANAVATFMVGAEAAVSANRGGPHV